MEMHENKIVVVEQLIELPNGDWILGSKVTAITFAPKSDTMSTYVYGPGVVIRIDGTNLSCVREFKTMEEAKAFIGVLAKEVNEARQIAMGIIPKSYQ